MMNVRVGVAVLGCVLSTGCGVTEVMDRADDGRAIVIRSPQVDVDDLVELHEEHGVRTVLNLRGESDADWFAEEAEGVEKIGARWVHVPVSGSKPTDPAHLQIILDLFEDPTAWPILMHCAGGIHRTGSMAGIYRIQYQGWNPDDAVEEMEDKYFNWTTRDRSALKEFVRAFRPDPDRSIDRSVGPEGPPPGPEAPAEGALPESRPAAIPESAPAVDDR